MLEERHIDTTKAPVDRRTKAECDSSMTLISFHVKEAVDGNDRTTAEYLFRTLMRECKFLSRKMGFSLE